MSFAEFRGRAFWVVLGCFVCQMGLGFGYGMTALAPALVEDLGWSRATFSSAQAPQVFFIAGASPLVWWVLLRLGARGLFALSAVLLGSAYVIVAGMDAWWEFAFAWALVGLAVTGLGDITVGAVMAQWFRERRGLALGMAYTGSNVGGYLATTLMVALAAGGSWRDGVGAMAGVAFCVLLPVALFAVRERGSVARVEDVDAVGEETDLSLGEAVRTRSFWILAFGLGVYWCDLYILLHHFGLAAVDAGFAAEQAAFYWKNAVLMGLLSKVAFGFVADRLPAKAAILLDYALLSVAIGSLLWISAWGAWGGWAFVVVFGFAYTARDVATPLAIAYAFGGRHLAQIYGVMMLTILLAGPGPVVAGAIRDATGSYAPGFGLLAALNVVSFLALWALRDERRRSARS
ncbi:MAG: MFS transporter [Myxococcota bacterium]